MSGSIKYIPYGEADDLFDPDLEIEGGARRFLKTVDFPTERLSRKPPAPKEIIGESDSLMEVIRQTRIVAPTNANVMILGETGTGKELIAQAIHASGRRSEGPFVKVNCAAIPLNLLESELFGHEKGAFTGAIARRMGRFELAQGGTLLLDEIGDIPLELQPKLLRVIQEREFERLGGSQTLRADVRIIAATCRDLREMVNARLFRMDLYYRLNVFPIRVPALRDRREDIPVLVRHFAQKYAAEIGTEIRLIPSSTISALASFDWPGNIRELENVIERSVILSPDGVLRLPSDLESFPAEFLPAVPVGASTLAEIDRQHIQQVLKECNQMVGGPRGAAARLGLKRTTLISKMKRLGLIPQTC
jgi:formate hydrogenlyase transcriptional activator